MRYELRIGEATHVVEATPLGDADRLRVIADGAEVEVTTRAISDHHLTIGIGGRLTNAWVARTETGSWVWLDGRARRVEDAALAPAPRRRSGTGLGGDVTPPMPAVVLRILVTPGAPVQPRQPLVVVSAMKMELTLVAPYAGVVSAIRTTVGDKVNPGDVLVEIAPEGAEEETHG
jgi:biotin carboxyl carrier protein